MREFLCSICLKRISRGWYCPKCYKEHKEAIQAKAPWTRFLQYEEKNRRRRPTLALVYLGDRYDISDDGRLIIRDGYNGR